MLLYGLFKKDIRIGILFYLNITTKKVPPELFFGNNLFHRLIHTWGLHDYHWDDIVKKDSRNFLPILEETAHKIRKDHTKLASRS
ncbi:hypothetical protein PR048_009132 [Dryococelus australis]|uniref:Uncharacterized protein n=1 Tax=Dryococelus australis TaxID=614101 RepID=A0ABQ9HZ12_9NEOP|nr:hypothetical protein PR048_009132 [Dryococelus australis]